MNYCLGFDGGGTKTHCVLIDDSGNVIGEGRSGPSNPLRCGYDAAFDSLREAAVGALAAQTFMPRKFRLFTRDLQARGAVT